MRHDVSADLSDLASNEEHTGKAGKAGAAEGRRYRQQRQVLRALLKLDVDDPKTAEILRSAGIEPSFANAIGFAVLRKAAAGDMAAARYVQGIVDGAPAADPAARKPVRAMDLTLLSDAELEALAELADE